MVEIVTWQHCFRVKKYATFGYMKCWGFRWGLDRAFITYHKETVIVVIWIVGPFAHLESDVKRSKVFGLLELDLVGSDLAGGQSLAGLLVGRHDSLWQRPRSFGRLLDATT